METLWGTWREHPGRRTILFCCSVAHAEFVKAWLVARGVRTAAIHSGPTADERSQALADLKNGDVDAVCAVDVLNEGVDVPTVDRVVMLRPTESSVVFLQQLGRGLRAADGKKALTVIDFVGNHKVFLGRLRTLLSLGPQHPGAALKALLDDGTPELPPGCSVDLELEAKDLLRSLFRATGADAVENAYRELAAAREDRPRAGELYRMGYSPRTLRTRHGSWWDFVASEGDLSDVEERLLEETSGAFLRHLETTSMTKSFKMVTLQALVEADAFGEGLEVSELARRAHQILRRDPRLLSDVPADLRSAELAKSKKWVAYWKRNPVKAWTSGKAPWFGVEDDRFRSAGTLREGSVATLSRLIAEMADYRLAQYRRRGGTEEGEGFECKVTWNKRDPILKLPSKKKRPDVPRQREIDARLEDGSAWTFRMAKEFCNVALRAGAQRNGLPDLLRSWFGPSAGQPGTTFHVRFAMTPDGWEVKPLRVANVLTLRPHAVRAYPDIQMAAGHVLGSSTAHESSEVELPIEPSPELFAVRVAGSSMDGGSDPIRDGAWAVFRPARGARPESLEGRVVLVQSPADDDDFAFVMKRLLRQDDGWVLSSDNPEGPTIRATGEMTVLARLEQAIDPESIGPRPGAVLTEHELSEAFRLTGLEAKSGRWGGHLFVFLGEGELKTPSETARGTKGRAPGETAFVLARSGSSWRYLGVGRFSEESARWRFPELDAKTWRSLGGKGVSRSLPEGAEARARELVDVLMALPKAERRLQRGGTEGIVVDKTKREGLRIESPSGEFEPRTISLTDLAWVCAAAADVEAKGGLLDEARVNRLRYLEGTRKSSTRWIDTGWAISVFGVSG